ncbi:MAG TPA: PhzF family phenazine biosynthesis protein [Xanthobacteraceae bacterium]|jgi:trans-2,3-dihydro-3-hydroxyanthranilate isomerase|nr:PhzF family phenazine biosynthesis protein [Xanthobacteraceae bacterium]
MQLHFVTVDVFADNQFGGNPLAVVLNAQGLETAQMQSIANEFNLAETTFVLPPKDAANTAHVRIFTPKAEMPFAGHPNVGTAFVLAQVGESYGKLIADDEVRFEEKAGLVRIEFLKTRKSVTGARLAAPQPFVCGEEIAPKLVAEAVGISASDIETARHAPCLASCGTPFVMAELKNRAALASARSRPDVFERDLPISRATGVHLYVQENANEADIQCRMFAPLHGVYEDPATGSAAVALIGLLASLHPNRDVKLEKVFAQGVEMGRPSRLEAIAQKTAGSVTATYVGGRCVPVMHGIVELD